MAKTKISEFNANPALNTDIDSINIAENCPPSGINDAIRELMSQLKDWQSGTSNDPYVVGSSGSLTLNQGTANGVPYLNGSKVVTSGSAFQFNGSNLFIGTASGTERLNVGAGSGAASGAEFGGNNNTIGSASLFVGQSVNGDAYLYQRANQPLIFGTNNTERMRLDSSGNLGLGVTPSAWSYFKAAQVGVGSLVAPTNASNTVVYNNAYYNGSSELYITSNAASQYQQLDGAHIWKRASSGTAGNAITFTQAMTLDASGNLGVGTTSPDSSSRLTLDRSTSNQVIMRVNGTQQLKIYADASVSSIEATNPLLFSTAGAERARIDSSGNLLVGTTNLGTVGSVSGSGLFASGYVAGSVANDSPGLFSRRGSDGGIVSFRRDTTQVGTISVSATATAYNTSSDYRLKNTIAPMTGALAKVALLKPCTYKWNANGSDGEGFIAHELADVFPQAVSGEKDAVDAEGNPQYQGIDVSFLVATLTAAIQELKAEFDAYKATHP